MNRYGRCASQSSVDLIEDTSLKLIPPPPIPVDQDISQEFEKLHLKFGFQASSVANQMDSYWILLQSRMCSKKLSRIQAITSLYQDFVNGPNANFKIWQEQHVDTLGFVTPTNVESSQISHVALYLLIWGEASNLRYCPELLAFLFQLALDAEVSSNEAHNYLTDVVTPLYNFVYAQTRKTAGKLRTVDHADIVGYDDVNETFWTSANIQKIQLLDGSLLMSLPSSERYWALRNVDWKKTFKKTFIERRSPLHLIVNFTPIWVLHASMFYLFLANAVLQLESQGGDIHSRILITCLFSVVAVLTTLISTLIEPAFVTLNKKRLLANIGCLVLMLIVNISPWAFSTILAPMLKLRLGNIVKIAISIATIPLSSATTVFCVFKPRIFAYVRPRFVNAVKPLPANRKAISIGLWVFIFLFKFVAAYFFLIEPFGEPLDALLSYISQCPASSPASTRIIVCYVFPGAVILVFVVLNFILFLLDTYIWWILCSTALGVFKTLQNGISTLHPWANDFAALPMKLTLKYLPGPFLPHEALMASSRIWNSIIKALFRDHLISSQSLSTMQFEVDDVEPNELPTIRVPPILSASGVNDSSSPLNEEGNAELTRRLRFLVQSMFVSSFFRELIYRSTTMPTPLPAMNIPYFTVMTPHYAEKILLSTRELIREYEGHFHSSISLLEYMKALNPEEWLNFVQDSTIFLDNSETSAAGSSIPLQTMGFTSSVKDSAMRTRIWASLRSQTLYRTISGFMMYERALRLLSSLESELGIEVIDHSYKFQYLVAMQRYHVMTPEEIENVDFLLETFPRLKISYICKETAADQPDAYFSCLLDSTCGHDINNNRVPLFKIRLPGPPVLGDGKADNQNHSIIFCRGEVLQLIDANQDQYAEEALKIGHLLAEFNDESTVILGAREHIFSQSIGALGDMAASKEYVFGTISQKVSSFLGARLHYGHPDMLRFVYMITRGGVSKGQKGLHLNEDIYSGMNVLMRGGDIRHLDYVQCGKGRDLGFGSILSFVSKIGSGMAEQILSREHYYLGNCLPLDRLLSFYMAHPGFHLNNAFSMHAIALFLFGFFMLSAFVLGRSADCNASVSAGACFDITIFFSWLKRSIAAIAFVMMLAYVPFLSQAVVEFGFTAAFKRLGKQIISLGPLFEVFTTQVYYHSLSSVGFSLGGATYQATGRGFVTYHLSFHRLFSAFTEASINFGVRNFILLLVISTGTSAPAHIGFFFFVSIALSVSPFIFNPHQFELTLFILDYRNFIHWMFSSNSEGLSNGSNWIEWYQRVRADITNARAHRMVLVWQIFLQPLLRCAFSIAAYLFIGVSQKKVKSVMAVLITPALLALIEVTFNFVLLAVILVAAALIGSVTSVVSRQAASIIGRIFHALSRSISIVISLVVCVAVFSNESWSYPRATVLLIAVSDVLSVIKSLILVLLSREKFASECNISFWDGQWLRRGMGFGSVLLPLRELFCKTLEQVEFATAFFSAHLLLFLLFPIALIPNVDTFHTKMLFWSVPDSLTGLSASTVMRTSDKRRAKADFICYLVVFAFVLLLTVLIVSLPMIVTLPSLSLTSILSSVV